MTPEAIITDETAIIAVISIMVVYCVVMIVFKLLKIIVAGGVLVGIAWILQNYDLNSIYLKIISIY